MCPYIKQGQLIVNVAKGIEAHTLTTLTDMIEEEIPGAQACVLSGPSHAESEPGIAYHLCSRCKETGNCRISAEYFYESYFSGIHQS